MESQFQVLVGIFINRLPLQVFRLVRIKHVICHLIINNLKNEAFVKMKHLKINAILVIIGIIVLSIIISVVLTINNAQKQYRSKIYTGETNKNFNTTSPFSVLLLGVDTGSDGRIEKGNSDTIMLVTVNPKNKKTLLLSLPRDALAEMVGDKNTNVQKLNAAYNIGGSKMAKQTVGKLLNVPINYYATFDMGGFEQIINAIGGVDIVSPQNVSFEHITIKKGKQHLNGKQALVYCRMRHEDPRGDYGRQLRQQQIIRATCDKLIKHENIKYYKRLLTSLNGNLKTDMEFNFLLQIALHSRGNMRNIHSEQIVGTPAWINGSSYQILSTANLQKYSNLMRSELELKKKKINNLETKLNSENRNYDGKTNLLYDTRGFAKTFYTN